VDEETIELYAESQVVEYEEVYYVPEYEDAA
jgi:hypothetical protein